ncbi:tRNA/rRNA methyltransferase SpoU [Lasiodiplodia theobromae]|nr:tRNA/rRNA methyltransferase SpoU [Lasiodiplodia theobromae]
MVEDGFLPVMDKMSDGRPHNGVVLEASPLPALPVKNLRPSNRTRPWFDFDLEPQRREEARINGTKNRLPYNSHGWRYPFVLFLDGIVDQGNLGAIIRSAYYLGVDAVAVTKRATAPLDAVAIKASSGAAEAMPLFTVSNPLAFLTRSTINGWRVYAADAPPPPTDNFNVTSDHYRRALDPDNTSPLVTYTRPNNVHVLPHSHAPLISHPTILMLGGESAGFRQSIRAKANYLVGIRGTRGLEVGVDSLNVSVAAALIMLEMVRKPTKLATDVQDILKKEFLVAQRLQKPEDLDDQVKNDELLF